MRCAKFSLLLLAACLLSPFVSAAADLKPNILFIFADDLGIADLSCYGSEIPTPNIDSIGRNGIKFQDYYVASPVCTPSRFGLLTGRYPNRSKDKLMGALMFAQEKDDHRGIRSGETTIAEVLRTNGYFTALIGKWHLGHGEPEFSPLKHGFDYAYGMNGGCLNYFTHKYGNIPDWHRNGQPVQEEGYVTDLLTEDAVRILKLQKPEKPFFMFLAYSAPHYGKGWDEAKKAFTNPLQAKPEYRERFKQINDPDRREYAGMVAGMDQGVGRVLDALRANNLETNTLVIFASDNGGDPHYAGCNKPFRGKKAQLFEGGIRVPCLAKWPGKIKPQSDTTQPISALDFFPTFCALTKSPTNGITLDGVNVSSVLLDQKQFDRDLFWSSPNYKMDALRRGQWKYMRHGSSEMLFDLKTDPIESTDLAATKPELLKELKAAHGRVAATLK